MDTKFVIFVLLSTFLVAAIYSSTVPIAFAKWNCNIPVRGSAKICTYTNIYGKIQDVIYCYKDKTGDHCLHVYGYRIGQDISPENLQNELNNNPESPGNNTKVPNTDILKDNVTVQENNDGGKQPKAPKVPEDGGLN
jgi:hypothetical protein